MKVFVEVSLVFGVLISFFCTTEVFAIPLMINYQGTVNVGATPFGSPTPATGSFRFAIVNSGATTTYWSNDGNTPPTASVSLTVTNGLYSVLLGDTALMQAIPSTVFDVDGLYLRVWFNDGSHGWQLLSPDQRMASTGFAYKAAKADLATTATTATNADTVDNRHATALDRGVLAVRYIIALQGVYPSQSKEETAKEGTRGEYPYVGEITIFAGNFAPYGWAFCEGQILQIATNTALYSLLGTMYGGNGTTTFALPDLRGRSPMHPTAGMTPGQTCGTAGCN